MSTTDDGRAGGRDRREQAEPTSAPAQAGERHERPHEVELLLDRERPQVTERRRAGEQVEVRLPGRDEAPVGDVEEPGDAVAAEAARARRSAPRAAAKSATASSTRSRAGRRRRARRPQNAPEPDAAARRTGGGVAAPLQHQQRGDQEAAEDEEGVDAEEAAGEPGLVEVEHHDRGHGERPEPVERGSVGERVLLRAGVLGPARRRGAGLRGRGGGRRHSRMVPTPGPAPGRPGPRYGRAPCRGPTSRPTGWCATARCSPRWRSPRAAGPGPRPARPGRDRGCDAAAAVPERPHVRHAVRDRRRVLRPGRTACCGRRPWCPDVCRPFVWRAAYVLEAEAGAFARWNVRVGDRLELTP